MARTYEDSPADRKADRREAGKRGIPMRQWEGSAADRRMDARQSPGGYVPNVHPRTHALTMASATHLHNMGHISSEHRDEIHEAAQERLAAHSAAKGAQIAPAARKPFGALAPMGGAPAPQGVPQAGGMPGMPQYDQ